MSLRSVMVFETSVQL